MRNTFRTSKILAPGLIALMLSGGGCSPRKPSDPAPAHSTGSITLPPAQRQKIKVQTVALATFRRTVETTGTVGFDNDQATEVLAPISGPVTRIEVSLGAEVKAGDPLATIASPDFATAVSAYRKGVATAANARRIADLDAQLFKSDAIARRDVEQAQTDAANAEADRDAARQKLRSLGADDSILQAIEQNRPVPSVSGEIRAPLNGTVVEKRITPGQLVQSGTTWCFTVADLSKVWVTANVFEADLPEVEVGDTADILTGDSTNRFSGKVDYVAALVDPDTRAVGVRVVVDNPGARLKKDMYVRVQIHSRRPSQGLLAPVSAVLRDEENLPFVYLVQPDGSFARHRVTLGSRVGDQYAITDGLKAGDHIVVDGGLFVQFLQNQ